MSIEEIMRILGESDDSDDEEILFDNYKIINMTDLDIKYYPKAKNLKNNEKPEFQQIGASPNISRRIDEVSMFYVLKNESEFINNVLVWGKGMMGTALGTKYKYYYEELMKRLKDKKSPPFEWDDFEDVMKQIFHLKLELQLASSLDKIIGQYYQCEKNGTDYVYKGVVYLSLRNLIDLELVSELPYDTTNLTWMKRDYYTLLSDNSQTVVYVKKDAYDDLVSKGNKTTEIIDALKKGIGFARDGGPAQKKTEGFEGFLNKCSLSGHKFEELRKKISVLLLGYKEKSENTENKGEKTYVPGKKFNFEGQDISTTFFSDLLQTLEELYLKADDDSTGSEWDELMSAFGIKKIDEKEGERIQLYKRFYESLLQSTDIKDEQERQNLVKQIKALEENKNDETALQKARQKLDAVNDKISLTKDLEGKISLLEGELNAAKNSSLQDSLKFENTSLKAKNTSMETENRTLKERTAFLQNDLDSLKTDITTLKNENISLKSGSTSMENEIKSLKDLKSLLENDLNTLKSENASLRSDKDSTSSEKFKSELSNTSLVNENSTLKTDLEKLNSEISTLRGKIDDITTKNVSLEADKAGYESQITSLKELNDKLSASNACESITKANEELAQKLADLEKTIASLTIEKDNAVAEKAKVEEEKQSLSNEKDAVLRDVESLRKSGDEKAEALRKVEKEKAEVLRKAEEDKAEVLRQAKEEMLEALKKAEEEKAEALKKVEEEKLQETKKLEGEKRRLEQEKVEALKKVEEEKLQETKRLEEEKRRLEEEKIKADEEKEQERAKALRREEELKAEQEQAEQEAREKIILPVEDYAKQIVESDSAQRFIQDYKIVDGGSSTYLERLQAMIHVIKKCFDLCKSHIILTLLTLFSDKDSFKTFQESRTEDLRTIFFIKVSDKIKNLKSTTPLKNLIERDTYVYKNIIGEKIQYDVVFIYTLLNHFDTKEGVKPYIETTPLKDEMMKLLNSVILSDNSKYSQLKQLYMSLRGNMGELNRIYTDLIEKNKRIITVIKQRQDTPTTNPRFFLTHTQNESNGKQYLAIKYNNVDGEKGFSKVKETETYTNLAADKEIKESQSLLIEEYHAGSFDYYFAKSFDEGNESQVIADQLSSELITEKILTQDVDICCVVLGQSGSGKTSLMVYFQDKKRDGVLIELCKKDVFIEAFEEIELQCQNIYTKLWNNPSAYQTYDYKEYESTSLLPPTKFQYGTIGDNSNWRSNGKTLGEVINDVFNKREVESTPNNPESSRSHVMCHLKLKRKQALNGNLYRNIVICDFAGVENKFQCENLKEIINFDLRYNDSTKYKGEALTYDKYFCSQTPPTDKETIKKFNMISKTLSADVYKQEDVVTETNKEVEYYENLPTIVDDKNDGYNSSSESDSDSSFSSDDSLSSDSESDADEDGGYSSVSSVSSYTDSSDSDSSDSDSSDSDTDFDSDADDTEETDLIKDEKMFETLSSLQDGDDDGTCKPRKKLNFCGNPLTRKWLGVDISETLKNINNTLEKVKVMVNFNKNIYKVLKFINDIDDSQQNVSTYKGSFNYTKFGYYRPDDTAKYQRYIEDSSGITLYGKKHLSGVHSYDLKSTKDDTHTQQNNYITLEAYISKAEDNDENLFLSVLLFLAPRQRQKDKQTVYMTIQDLFDASHGLQTFLTKGTMTKGAFKNFKSFFLRSETFTEYKEKYFSSLENLKEILCEKHRFKALLFNCPLRVHEGMMINHFLKDVADDIKGLLRNSIRLNNAYLPIYYDKDISPRYRDLYVEDDVFSVFNNTQTPYKPKGKMCEIITEQFKMDLSKLNFMVVNIINTTDSQVTPTRRTINNPPTPPYINITNMIYHLPLVNGGMRGEKEFNINKLKDVYGQMLKLMNNYQFYRDSTIYSDIIKFDMESEDNSLNIINQVKKLIDLVKANNPSSLIGSMETVELLQSNMKFIYSDNKDVKIDSITFRDVKPSPV